MCSDELVWCNLSANNANVTKFGTLGLWEVPHMCNICKLGDYVDHITFASLVN